MNPLTGRPRGNSNEERVGTNVGGGGSGGGSFPSGMPTLPPSELTTPRGLHTQAGETIAPPRLGDESVFGRNRQMSGKI